jgi:DNA polymerase-3 subunit epsilon
VSSIAAGDRTARRRDASVPRCDSVAGSSTGIRSARSSSRAAGEQSPGAAFTAIDFETADYGADSACALALVHVRGLEIVGRDLFLIRPPRSRFAFTHIHGITWAHVRGERSFAELWPEIAERFAAASFLAAHNAPFDRGVLAACCAAAGAAPPALDFHCTVRLARRAWGLARANLPAVCAHLGIALNHHDPASDAEACARIVIAARREGIALGTPLSGQRRGRL